MSINTSEWRGFLISHCGIVLIKIHPHVLPTQTAWQRRRKDNICALPGSAEPSCGPLSGQTPSRDVTAAVCRSHCMQDGGRTCSLASQTQLLNDLNWIWRTPCSDAMQVATKVITSWLPSITSLNYLAGRATADPAGKKHNTGTRLPISPEPRRIVTFRCVYLLWWADRVDLRAPHAVKSPCSPPCCRFTLTELHRQATSSDHSAAKGKLLKFKHSTHTTAADIWCFRCYTQEILRSLA